MAEPTLQQLNSWERDLWRIRCEMDSAYPDRAGEHDAEAHALVNCAWRAIRRDLTEREQAAS